MKLSLNLGSGTHIIKDKGWKNVDNYYIPTDKDDLLYFVKGDVRNLPFEANTVDYIICDQVLEHIPMSDIVPVLYEIRRVLKVGGRCVIIVPDFRSAVNQWCSINHDLNFDPLVYHWLSEVIYGNQLHEGEFHKTAMTPGYLNFTLNTVGLTTSEIVVYPAFGEVPRYPGVRPSPADAKCRNAQLVADITKKV